MTEETNEQHTPTDPISRAEAAAKRIEAANERMAELMQQQQELAARNILGGESDAGQAPPKKQEESAADYADRALRGEVGGEKQA